MRRNGWLALALVISLGALGSASCSSGNGGSTGGGGTSGGGTGGGGTGGSTGSGGAALQWYTSCGDPICNADPDAGSPDGGSGAAKCTTEKEGDACATGGQTCDPGLGCGVLLVCAKSDPKSSPGGCPISRARFKKDIDYVSDARRESLHDELMAMRLATWRYKAEADGSKTHLGFIIDDNPESASVDATGDRVDLYGYTSMVAAAVQVQNKRIEALEREVQALREELKAQRSQKAAGAR